MSRTQGCEVVVYVKLRAVFPRHPVFIAIQGFHFSGISGNLEMSGNSLKSAKSPGMGQSRGKVGEFVLSLIHI